MEAAELCLFMASAALFGTLLEYPGSPIHQAVPAQWLRRLLMGLLMGSTAIAIIYSPMGKQSGAHFNPSVTLAFLRLKKIAPWDAAFYVLAQFTGGVIGLLLVAAALGAPLAHPSVNYVATLPGPRGPLPAFVAEVFISFLLMSVVLRVSNVSALNRYTGLFAGILVATYITLEAPLSGMSMNPARTFASALPGKLWMWMWIYFIAPPLGMLLAAETYVRFKGIDKVYCAKFHHENDKRCIFRCRYMEAAQPAPGA
ncbi:MAG: MIP/aquaporin family protein [Nevskiales bacterium]